ncbi:MAG: V-type ATP synthase subunit I [Treponema sp.]|jgi:V/A-type H+-transporting ATPase subunit I|nr:V-type ATP synthase subunit I [Treponema sp.]
MLRPRKMKFIELTVLKNDMNTVLEFLGKRGAIHFPDSQKPADTPSVSRLRQIIDRLLVSARFIGIKLDGMDTNVEDENISVPGIDEEELTERICSIIENLESRQIKTEQEKQRIRETLNETQAFSRMNVPFSELEQLSYLTLRIGRLDPKGLSELGENMGERAVIIPLDAGNRIMVASSKKGRFALDSQLKKFSFEPVAIPQDYRGIPSEMTISLEDQLARLEDELQKINSEKEMLRQNTAQDIKRLFSTWNTAITIEEIKARFIVTESFYHFSGWTPADMAAELAKDLLVLTGSRVAIRTYSPNEISSVADGSEKVPVLMKHGAFVRGFEGVVFSYGAPLYGTIDPTPLVAFFFTVLFGIMFGDVGQGFVLFFAGVLISKGPKQLAKFSKFSTPLIAVGISSMIMGLLNGAVFTNENLLVVPTRAVTAFFSGHPMDRILTILPLSERGGSLKKLLFFFGFTIGVGVLLNSAGLLINIANRCILKKYEAAFFSKTGLAGLLFFWYALFIAIRIILGGSFALYDFAGLLIPVLCIFFGPVIWRIIAGDKPVLEHGLMTFIMEGFVEILETVSSYISNTVSFLRVGAFALSHAVLSFIVFTFSEELARANIAGPSLAFLIMISGNAIIIVLEGMIVAIQIMRLQYYEFFNKFFIETGVEFAPFRFKTRKT